MSHDQEQSLLSSAADDTDRSDNSSNNEMPAANPASNHAMVLRKIAAVMGSSGVAMGAFGAHALKETLTKKGTAAMWQTATIYQLFHAAAILSLASATTTTTTEQRKTIASNHLLAGKLMGVGNLLFSGSIYCLALDVGPKKILGPITPIGGLLMIGGWIVIGLV